MNKNFQPIVIDEEEVPAYRIKKKIWGAERTCIVTVSSQLKEGQIRVIEQHLETKYKLLEKLKQQLENPKRRKILTESEIKNRLIGIIKGQFVDQILKYAIFKLEDGIHSFTYFIDADAHTQLQEEVLGRKILVTNQHEWSAENIILACRGQSKVEYAFRTLKNPMHLAVCLSTMGQIKKSQPIFSSALWDIYSLSQPTPKPKSASAIKEISVTS